MAETIEDSKLLSAKSDFKREAEQEIFWLLIQRAIFMPVNDKNKITVRGESACRDFQGSAELF